MRRLILAVLVASAAAMLAPHAGHAEPPSLAGENTVHGDGVTKMTVIVPKQTQFLTETLQVTGLGRLVGVGLAQGEGFVAAYRIGMCPAPACDPGTRSVRTSYSKDLHPWLPLEAGTYTLYVYTDGAPATVRFGMKDLEGQAEFTPSEPGGRLNSAVNDRALADPLPERFPVWGAGADVEAGESHAYYVATLIYDANLFQTAASWFCTYPGGAPTSGNDPYGPGCPGHDPADRLDRSRCNLNGKGLVPSPSGGFITGFSATACGDSVAPGERLGVGHAALIVPTRTMMAFVVQLS